MPKPFLLISALLFVSLAVILVLLVVDPNNQLLKIFSIEPNDGSLTSSSSSSPSSPSSSITVLPKLCRTPKDSTFPPLEPPPVDAPAVIKDYVSFHKRGRQCLLSGECKAPPLLLYDSLHGHNRGGLGYRIAAIRWSFLFAIATHRLLLIPWSHNDTAVSIDITTALQPASIDWRPPWDVLNEQYLNIDMTDSDGVHRRHVASFSNIKHLHDTLGFQSIDGAGVPKNISSKMYKLSKSNFTKAFDPFDVIYLYATYGRAKVTQLFSNPFYRHGVFNEFSNNETFITVLERLISHILFRPSQTVSDLVNQRVFSSPPEPFVSVHMRTGDDLNETNQNRMHHIMDYLSLYADRMLDCAVQIHPAGKERIFLASDSMAFKHLFVERASLRGITVMTQQERSAVHFKRFAAVNESDLEMECMQFHDVFADVFALGRAVALVGRPSSFAAGGIALGEPKRAVQLYLPAKQQKGECDVEGIVSGKMKGSMHNGFWYDGPLGKVGKLYKKAGFKNKNWS